MECYFYIYEQLMQNETANKEDWKYQDNAFVFLSAPKEKTSSVSIERERVKNLWYKSK